MKPQLSFVLLIVFMLSTLWLSFLVKGHKQENQKLTLQLHHSKKQHSELAYETTLLKELFKDHVSHSKQNINIDILKSEKNHSASILLYLKAHSCSPCNLPTIRALAEDVKAKEHFIIVSHRSNQHFLSMVLSDEEMENQNIIVFTDEELYSHHSMDFDAEILFLNRDNFIKGIIPLDYLKEPSIFEWVMAFV